MAALVPPLFLPPLQPRHPPPPPPPPPTLCHPPQRPGGGWPPNWRAWPASRASPGGGPSTAGRCLGVVVARCRTRLGRPRPHPPPRPPRAAPALLLVRGPPLAAAAMWAVASQPPGRRANCRGRGLRNCPSGQRRQLLRRRRRPQRPPPHLLLSFHHPTGPPGLGLAYAGLVASAEPATAPHPPHPRPRPRPALPPPLSTRCPSLRSTWRPRSSSANASAPARRAPFTGACGKVGRWR